MELLLTLVIIILVFNIIIWSAIGLFIFVNTRRILPDLLLSIRTSGLQKGLDRVSVGVMSEEIEVKKINAEFDRQAAERAAAAAAGKAEKIQVMNADSMAEEFIVDDDSPVKRSLTK